MEPYALLTFFITAAVLVGGAILFAYYAAPNNPGGVKSEPYECGIPTEGPTWIQFRVGYYLFAIILKHFPARSAVAGSGLVQGARVEIECIAVILE